MSDVMALAEGERADLLDLLEELAPHEWEAPTACDGWSVRDVAAHTISYDVLSPAATAGAFLRGRLSVDRINELLVERYRPLPTSVVLEHHRAHPRPRGLAAGFGGRIALTDAMVHQQDVRRALGRPRAVPAERLEVALPFAMRAPTLSARSVARGVRLVATDLDWSWGAGAEVRGTGEALLVTVAGRGTAVAELDGPGRDLVAPRVA